MSRHTPRRRQPPPKPTAYAGPTTCLRCDDVFESWDRRQNRLCPHCLEASEEQPSDEPSYRPLLSRRRFRNMDDG
jgi:hypothetical protein